MDMDDFWVIFNQSLEEEPTGFKENARWPHPGRIYIELSETLPEGPEEYPGVVHGFIITQDSGDDTRGVVIPAIKEGWLGTVGVRLNIKTGAITGGGPGIHRNPMTELVRRLAAFLADENTEIVEMPLSRKARRRLQKSGQLNPWHVARRRRGFAQ